MRNDQISTASYTAVIADLRAKREELDRTIRMLEAMSQLEPTQITQEPLAKLERATPVIRQQSTVRRTARVIRSSGIGEECVRILKESALNGDELSTRQVTDLLLESGFKLKAANPINNVHSALNHRSKVSRDVERVGRNWRYIGEPEKGASEIAGQASQEVNGTIMRF